MHGRGITLECIEGEPFQIPEQWRMRLLAAALRLKKNLRPRHGSITEVNGEFICRGIIGTIDLGFKLYLNVSPKVHADADWITPVVRLLLGADRIDAGGDRLASYSAQRRNLFDVLAAQYANRLESALCRDGPILLLRRQEAISGIVKGKLRISEWLRAGPATAHRLPIAYNELVTNHPISAAMEQVARLLAAHSTVSVVRRRLLAAARNLRPGAEPLNVLPPEVVRQNLPVQWRAYEPAWSLARAVIYQRSLLGPKGQHTGISIAVEAWPLLERLLTRCLAEVAELAHAQGRNLSVVSKRNIPLLVAQPGSTIQNKEVIPDGRLDEGGKALVIFDAKYKRREEGREFPERADSNQAVATLVAHDECRVVVLVYPEDFPPERATIQCGNGKFAELIMIGLGLFSCRTPADQLTRSRRLFDLLPASGGGTAIVPPVC